MRKSNVFTMILLTVLNFEMQFKEVHLFIYIEIFHNEVKRENKKNREWKGSFDTVFFTNENT